MLMWLMNLGFAGGSGAVSTWTVQANDSSTWVVQSNDSSTWTVQS